MIKKKWLALGMVTLTILALVGFTIKKQDKDYSMYPRHEIIAQKINCDVAQELAALYGLHPRGTGGRIHEEVEKMFLSLGCYRKLNVDEARRLIVICALKYIEAFNSNVELRPHLSNYPFTANNIELVIIFFSPDHEEVKIGELVVVNVIKGEVEYSKRKAEYGHELIREETFEEALRIVEEEQKQQKSKPT